MPHCIVPSCTNYSQRSDCSISFHRISSNQQMKKKWLARIPRANPCPTAYLCVCSDNFTSDCFELSLMSQFTGQKERRRLRAGSIPSVFPQRTGGATSEPSLTSCMQSENRKDRRERKEVQLLTMVITSASKLDYSL